MSFSSPKRSSFQSPEKGENAVSYTQNFENSKKALFSALVLIARDKLKAREKYEKENSTEQFWSQIQGLISKHEDQMGKLTVEAVQIRSKLNNKRLAQSKAHTERMNKLKAEYAKIQQELKALSDDNTQEKTEELKQEEKQLRESIQENSEEVEQINERVRALQSETDELKKNLRQQTAETEARTTSVKARRQVSTESADKVDKQLINLQRELEEADSQIEELNDKTNLVKLLVDTLESSKAPIHSIFLDN